MASLPQPDAVEVVSLRLRVRIGDLELQVLDDLGLHPAHPRYLYSLPSDEELYRALLDDESRVASPRRPALWDEVLRPRFALAAPVAWGAGAAQAAVLYPVVDIEPSLAGAQPDRRPPLQRDGLAAFDAALFSDPDLDGVGAEALTKAADFLRYRSEQPRELVGMHSLFAIDEVTLIVAPDAVHRRWQEREEPRDDTAPTQPEPVLERVECREVHAERRHVRGGPKDGLDVLVVTRPGSAFERCTPAVWQLPSDPGPVEPLDIGASLPSASVVILDGQADVAAPSTLSVHASLLRMCAARGDQFTILSLPQHLREQGAVAHLRLLRAGGLLQSDSGEAAVVSAVDARSLSFGALYHPWPITAVEDEPGVPRAIPPDGAVSGQFAARARARGAWVAPANVPFVGVIGLDPVLPTSSYRPLAEAGANTLRHEPRGLLCLSARTISEDVDLRQLTVRRLLSLLRRAAERDGPAFVFEPNGDALSRHVRRGFEAMLSQLLDRGAFAGTGSEDSFQVIVGRDDSRASSDGARIVVELKVAPSLPMRFLTVRLVMAADGNMRLEAA
jgi:hypothetical protein